MMLDVILYSRVLIQDVIHGELVSRDVGKSGNALVARSGTTLVSHYRLCVGGIIDWGH
jgi:hypothetical protein